MKVAVCNLGCKVNKYECDCIVTAPPGDPAGGLSTPSCKRKYDVQQSPDIRGKRPPLEHPSGDCCRHLPWQPKENRKNPIFFRETRDFLLRSEGKYATMPGSAFCKGRTLKGATALEECGGTFMSATYEKVSSNKAKLSFTVPAEQFEAAMQKAYLKNRGKINVPGFRRGKAPRKLIETMYGESVFYDDAFQLIFPDLYDEAVKENNLQVVDQPEVDVQEIGEGKDLVFSCEVYVRPDVTLGDYKGLTVNVTKQTVTDADIDARIEQDRKKVARQIDVEGALENGDTVKLNYMGTVDGVAFEGGTAENQTLTLGSGQFIPGFEEQMVGMNIGEEKDLNVTFPEKYHSEELAGKNAVFHVKVLSATRTELPKLDDDFAADASEYNTFAEYKDSIVKELNDRAAKNNEIAVENALVEKAVENASMDIPQAMINEQTNYLLREMQMRMAYQGLKMEDYLKYTGQTIEQLADMYKGEAEHRVKVELTLDAIRKAEGIEPTDEDVAKQIAEQAERMGQSVEDFEKTLTDEQRGYLRDTAAIQKVVDLMKQDCTVEEKKEEAAEEKAADAE